MTQKELAYIEDAIGHEQNIIKLINISIPNISDENIISFMKKELNIHKNILKKIQSILEEKSNER